jgi:hypothetical protein
MSQFHVRQIATHVRETFGSIYWNDNLDEVNNLSRMLAAHATTLVLGGSSDDSERATEVTDGTDDRGIDAVGTDRVSKLVVFVQAKWRQDGTGSLSLNEVLKFLDGVRSLLGMRANEEPIHASEDMRRAIQDLLRTPGARIKLVTATTGSDPLASPVEDPIKELLGQLNDLDGTEPLATHVHYGQAALFNSLTVRPRPVVDLDVIIQDWGRATDPLKAFYGRVSAAQIAEWYAKHGVDLFAENIRVVIPRSDVNQGILETVRAEPERFVYYNNGITVLADTIEVGPGGTLTREVGYFRLRNASIVNGAQTVSTLGKALDSDFEANLGRAFVLVRCIEVAPNERDLSRRITRFANTQNEISSQDFAFLDEQQHRLARELRVLGFEYLVRSAETPRTEDPSKVIDIRQAAVALACASPDVAHSVIAKREVSRLFSDPGIYRTLFNPSTDAYRLVRAVLIMRRVNEALDAIATEAEGIQAGVAVHGRTAVAHILLREVGDAALADPGSDIPQTLRGIDARVPSLVAGLVEAFPANSYPGNVFKNLARCTELLKASGLRG